MCKMNRQERTKPDQYVPPEMRQQIRKLLHQFYEYDRRLSR